MQIRNYESWAFAWVAKAVNEGQFSIVTLAIKSLDPDRDLPGTRHSILPKDGYGWIKKVRRGDAERHGYYPVAYALQELCYCSTAEEAAGLVTVLNALAYMYSPHDVWRHGVYDLFDCPSEFEKYIEYLPAHSTRSFTLRDLAAAKKSFHQHWMEEQEKAAQRT